MWIAPEGRAGNGCGEEHGGRDRRADNTEPTGCARPDQLLCTPLNPSTPNPGAPQCTPLDPNPIGAIRRPAYNSLAVIPPLPDLVLYARTGCGLCDEARAALQALLADRSAHGLPVPNLVERDIDTDEDWHRRYAFTIPVVVLGGRELELATSPAKLRRLLADGLDPEAEPAA